MTWGHRFVLFAVGVCLSVALFLIGGIAVGDHSTERGPTVRLSPYVQSHYCDYDNCNTRP